MEWGIIDPRNYIAIVSRSSISTCPNVDVRLNATSANEVKLSDNNTYNVVVGKYGGSHEGADGKTPVGDQVINMDQAEKQQQNGGNTAAQSVFHEVVESYSALKMGTGIWPIGLSTTDWAYTHAHAAAKALDPKYSDDQIKVDSHLKAGFDTPNSGASVCDGHARCRTRAPLIGNEAVSNKQCLAMPGFFI